MNNWPGIGDILNDEAFNYLWHSTAHFQGSLIRLKQKIIVSLPLVNFRGKEEKKKIEVFLHLK